MIRSLWSLLGPRDRARLLLVLGAMTLSGLVELAGIGSVVPFLAVAGDPSLVDRQPLLKAVAGFLGFTNPLSFTIALGIGVIAFLVGSNCLKAAVNILTIRFGKDRMQDWSVRLYTHLLRQPYPFFLHKTSAEIVTYLWDDLPTMVSGVLVPILNIIARMVVVLGLVVLVLVADPGMALVLFLVFGVSYGLLFGLIRRPLSTRGAQSVALSQSRYQQVLDSLGGIKDVKFLELEEGFLRRYAADSRTQYDNDSARDTLATFPKYLLETLAFGGVVSIVLIYLISGKSLAEVLPVLGLYAFAGYRLMPSLQQIFTDMAKIRYSAPRVASVLQAFSEGVPVTPLLAAASGVGQASLPFQSELAVRDLRFRYPKSDRWVLDGLTLQVSARTTVGLVGPSGSGKTSLVDVLLGLLPFDQGHLSVDGRTIDQDLLRAWKALLGYVPQQIFLTDGSVAQNIAFGDDPSTIDLARVKRAAERAHVHRFIEEDLEAGYQTLVGERGVRLSGGQRQRLGIARALYREPQVLILDEATSALDGVSETEVMDAIASLGGAMTMIIVAHRLTTLRACDRIFVLEQGRITDSGTYDSLMAGNRLFQAMARSHE